MKYIDQVNLNGKRVFIRADLNVPLNEKNEVADDTRIRETLPTLRYALENGGRVILASHFGRPKGKRVESMSLKPVARHLEQEFPGKVTLAPDCVGKDTLQLVEKLQPGNVLLLENLRFHPQEEANDANFAKQLGDLCDVFVLDAFGTAHRAHASTVGITAFVKENVGGFTMKRELEYFSKAFDNPERPFVVIIGGAKVSTKIDAIRNVGDKADTIIIGGAMANTFFAGEGYDVGKSLYEADQIENAKGILDYLKKRNVKILLPTDVVVAEEMKPGVKTAVVPIDKIPSMQMALDIGPDSVKAFAKEIAAAKTIVWNGPVGAFETEGFAAGTNAIIDAVAASPALTVVGGGDSALALSERGATDKVSFVSTGGGAFLEQLEGKVLPGVAALG